MSFIVGSFSLISDKITLLLLLGKPGNVGGYIDDFIDYHINGYYQHPELEERGRHLKSLLTSFQEIPAEVLHFFPEFPLFSPRGFNCGRD